MLTNKSTTILRLYRYFRYSYLFTFYLTFVCMSLQLNTCKVEIFLYTVLNGTYCKIKQGLNFDAKLLSPQFLFFPFPEYVNIFAQCILSVFTFPPFAFILPVSSTSICSYIFPRSAIFFYISLLLLFPLFTFVPRWYQPVFPSGRYYSPFTSLNTLELTL